MTPQDPEWWHCRRCGTWGNGGYEALMKHMNRIHPRRAKPSVTGNGSVAQRGNTWWVYVDA